MKAIKVKISGSYWDGPRGNVVDYNGVEGIIPFCDEDLALQHLRRYVGLWISADKETYPDRFHDVRELFLDDSEEIDHKFSFVGKDIKEMTIEELQDLATAKDLKRIPFPKKGSTREARVQAYAAYSNEVLGKEIDTRAEGFNFAKLPPLKADGKTHRNLSRKVTNQEVIDAETANSSTTGKPKSNLSLAELKEIADQKGLQYPKNVKYDALYNMLFGS